MNYKLLLSTLLILFSFWTHAQNDSGRVRIFTKPEKAIIKIEHQTIDYGKFYLLDSGTYKVRTWSEGMEILEKEIKVTKGSYSTLRMKMEPTKEYKAYRSKLLKYKSKKFALEKVPAIFLVGFSAYKLVDLTLEFKDKKEYLDNANQFEEQYNNSFWVEDIEANRAGFNKNKELYQNSLDNIKSKTTSLIIGASISTAAIYLGRKVTKKMVKPTFSEKPKMTASIIPTINSTYQGLHFNLTF